MEAIHTHYNYECHCQTGKRGCERQVGRGSEVRITCQHMIVREHAAASQQSRCIAEGRKSQAQAPGRGAVMPGACTCLLKPTMADEPCKPAISPNTTDLSRGALHRSNRRRCDPKRAPTRPVEVHE